MGNVSKGALHLNEEVFARGLCTACGGCVGYCPYIKAVFDRVNMIYPCNGEDGLCYKVCPRTSTNLPFLRAQAFGEETPDFNGADNLDAVLGVHRAVYFARAGEKAGDFRGQYGGVTTSLVGYALSAGKINGALLVGGTPTQPAPVLATGLEQVKACAGSKYVALPTLSMLYQETQNISLPALVGRPCQVTSLRKMQRVKAGLSASVRLVIGLFCFWSPGPEFIPWLEEKGLGPVEKMDVTTEDVLFQKDKEMIHQNLEEIRPFIKTSCQLCYDPVAELADLSVGATEYEAGWNTLIVRSPAGEELVKEALQQDLLRVKPYPEERLPFLKQAVFQKKQRVLQTLTKNENQAGRAGYLDLTPAEISYYLGA